MTKNIGSDGRTNQKGRFRLRRNALGIGGILPQPDHCQDRNKWQRGDQTAEARAATRHLRDGHDDEPG